MQHAGPHTGTGGGIAGDAIAGSDEGVGAVVHIKQGALSAFEQEVCAGLVRVIEFAGDIGHHGREQLGMFHRLRIDQLKLHFPILDVGRQIRSEIKGLRTQKTGQHMVMQGQ